MKYIDPINYSKQIKNLLVEMEVAPEDPLADQVRQFAQLVEKIDSLKAQLKHLEDQYPQLEAPIYKILEDLQTVDTDVNKSIKVGNELIVTFARKPYEQTKVKYKEAFEYLYGKVNGAIKKLADEAKDATASIAKVKGSVKVTKLEAASSPKDFNAISQEFSNSVDSIDQDFQKLFASAAKQTGNIAENGGAETTDKPVDGNRSYLKHLTPDEQTQLKEYIDSIKEIKKEISKLMSKAKGGMMEQGGNMSSGLTLKTEEGKPEVKWNWSNASYDDAEYADGKKHTIIGSVDGKDTNGDYYTAKFKAKVVGGEPDMDNAELYDIKNTDK